MKPLHEERQITFAELGALLGFRHMLLTNTVTHSPEENSACGIGNAHLFNMGVALKTNVHCGTIGCIGGGMALIMGNPASYVGSGIAMGQHSPALRNLFFPPHSTLSGHINWEDITNQQAVQAIDNWLRTGEPRWEEVVFGPWPKLSIAKLSPKVAALRKKPAKKAAKPASRTKRATLGMRHR